jgi:hypothetical protein
MTIVLDTRTELSVGSFHLRKRLIVEGAHLVEFPGRQLFRIPLIWELVFLLLEDGRMVSVGHHMHQCQGVHSFISNVRNNPDNKIPANNPPNGGVRIPLGSFDLDAEVLHLPRLYLPHLVQAMDLVMIIGGVPSRGSSRSPLFKININSVQGTPPATIIHNPIHFYFLPQHHHIIGGHMNGHNTIYQAMASVDVGSDSVGDGGGLGPERLHDVHLEVGEEGEVAGWVYQYDAESVLNVAMRGVGEGARHGGREDEGEGTGVLALLHIWLEVGESKHAVVVVIVLFMLPEPFHISPVLLTPQLQHQFLVVGIILGINGDDAFNKLSSEVELFVEVQAEVDGAIWKT